MTSPMSLSTLFSCMVILCHIAMFPEVIADQELSSVNCSYDSFSGNGTYSINLSTLLQSIKDLANQVASSDTSNNIHKIQSSSFGGGFKYFGTNIINFAADNSNNNGTTVYEMAQCKLNLSVQSCNSCLMSMINQISKGCKGRIGERVGSRNCFIRYETYPFYNISAMECSLPPLFTDPIMVSNTRSHHLGKISLNTIIAITIPAAMLIGLFTFGIGLCIWKTKQRNNRTTSDDDYDLDAIESLKYSLDALKAATQNFAEDNKVGQGGFGSVYKGVLQNGQEIAVKKLFKSTSHVDQEFKNEVAVLAKLQHRNLVRLLGFCLVEEERLLVFEYVPNSTLEKLLFDPRGVGLNWITRFKIINGIAQGLLYLHEESRHKIVHRDLKPGNILLDAQMNPKIADFGMARFYGIKQEDYEVPTNARGITANSGIDPTHQSTRTGGGTFGYMAPEISRRGHFSVKTDVYSYGVMILEIISGKRNTRFHLSGLAEDLLSYSWMQWKAGNPLALIDENLLSENATTNPMMKEQVLICIHIGLLCIQKDPKMRPTIRMIVQKYSNICEKSKQWAT